MSVHSIRAGRQDAVEEETDEQGIRDGVEGRPRLAREEELPAQRPDRDTEHKRAEGRHEPPVVGPRERITNKAEVDAADCKIRESGADQETHREQQRMCSPAAGNLVHAGQGDRIRR